MVKKQDNFGEIAKDLGQSINTSPFISIIKRRLFLFLISFLMALILLFVILAFPRRSEYDEIEIPQAIREQHQALKASDYKFIWTTEDFDRLTASYTMKGDHLDDVVAKYGKASRISSYKGSDDLYVDYEEDYNHSYSHIRSVNLTFKRFEDGEFYLSHRYFSGFEIPEEIRPVFKANGVPITKDVAQRLDQLADTGGDNGEALEELTNLYTDPDDMYYMRSDSGENIIMTYYVESNIDTLQLHFSRYGEKVFKLSYAVYTD